MDKNTKIGGKSVVFILRGTPSEFQVEMITDACSLRFHGSDLTEFIGRKLMDNEDFKKNFTAV